MMQVHPMDTASLIISLLSLVTWGVWVLRNQGKALYAVPPVTWTVNVVAFVATSAYHDARLHELWSDFLILHATVLIFGIGVALFLERFLVDPRK